MQESEIVHRENRSVGGEHKCHVMDLPRDVIQIRGRRAEVKQVLNYPRKVVAGRSLFERRFKGGRIEFSCDLPEYLLDTHPLNELPLNVDDLLHRRGFSMAGIDVDSIECRGG